TLVLSIRPFPLAHSKATRPPRRRATEDPAIIAARARRQDRGRWPSTVSPEDASPRAVLLRRKPAQSEAPNRKPKPVEEAPHPGTCRARTGPSDGSRPTRERRTTRNSAIAATGSVKRPRER